MQEKVEEYPLGSKLHLNAILVWGFVDFGFGRMLILKDHISIFFILLYDMVY